MLDVKFGEHLRELRQGEVRAALGEDLVDGHPVGPEPVLGSPPVPQQRVGVLVIEGFDVGAAALVFDRDVKNGVSAEFAALPCGLRRPASRVPPAAAGRDFADLLDVEVPSSPRWERS